MAMQRLFGAKITPACKYCWEGFPTPEDAIICAKHGGVVLPDHKCKHFFYDPLCRVPKRPLPLEKYEAEEFALD